MSRGVSAGKGTRTAADYARILPTLCVSKPRADAAPARLCEYRASDSCCAPPRLEREVPLAQGATIHQFAVQLSHVDRGVYETLDLRVARHPSETAESVCARVLAYCLEYQDGLAFTRGLAEPDLPALEVRDLTGALKAWVEVGMPDGARLHRASKAVGRVAVYMVEDGGRYWESLAGATIHRAEALELYALERGLMGELVSRIERRTTFDLAVTDGTLYLTMGPEVFSGAVTRHRLST